MSLGNVKQSANFVPPYQASGVPFVATAGVGATKTINLKYVTSEVTVANSGTDASTVSFGLTNSADFTIPANSVVTFRIRARKIVITSGAASTTSVVAALTTIKNGEIPVYDQNDYGTVA
jgi:hypothetical protein